MPRRGVGEWDNGSGGGGGFHRRSNTSWGEEGEWVGGKRPPQMPTHAMGWGGGGGAEWREPERGRGRGLHSRGAGGEGGGTEASNILAGRGSGGVGEKK